MKTNEHLREEQVVPYLDGRVGADERVGIDAHLEACAECRTRLSELRGVLDVLGEWPAVEASAGFTAAVRARVEAEAQRQSRGWSWRWPRTLPNPREVRGWVYAGAAVVAAAVLLVVLRPASPPPSAPPTPIAQPTETPGGVTPGTETVKEGAGDDLAAVEPILLENYELLREFDILFEAQPKRKSGSVKRGT